MLLNVNSITKYIKDKKILENVSFKIYEKQKIGLIGPNGAGKSTLLKVIMKEIISDDGSVDVRRNIGYLPQDFSMDEDKTVEEFLNEYEFHHNLIPTLNRLNINDKYRQRIETLSGGEKTRLYITRIILSNPQLLILDEPTNHLDYEGIKWLVDFISKFQGGVLIVSHDRYFLEKTVNKILELEKGSLREYNGGYSFYKDAKEKEFEREIIAYEAYKKEKKKLELAARKVMERSNKYNNMSQNDFYRGKAAKIAKRSKAIISRLEQMEEVSKPNQPLKINLAFDEEGKRLGDILVRGEKLKKVYENTIFENISFQIQRNKRIGIIGKNGVGKSTLLKAIVGIESVDGNITISPSIKIGYFSQELKNLDENLTLLDEVKNIEADQSKVRNLMACMLFKGEDVFKKISNLSFGERVRIIFLKLILGGYQLLVLDEPTNFLDIISREKIEEALLDYEGAILFVSHDHYFVRRMAQEIWEMDNKGITRYLGDYEYYLDKKSQNEEKNNRIPKEEILNLEMELSTISFKLISCNDNEKKELEEKYFEVLQQLKYLKNNFK